MLIATAVLCLLMVTPTTAQAYYECEEYDVSTGKGKCNGIPIDVGNALCAQKYDKFRCFVQAPNTTVTFRFRVGGCPIVPPLPPLSQCPLRSRATCWSPT